MTKHSDRPAEDSHLRGGDLIAPSTMGLPSAQQHSRSARLPIAATDHNQGGEEPNLRPTGGITSYLHAVRRYWPAAISAGLACAIIAVIPTWFLSADKYTAVALLQISANEQQLVFQNSNPGSANTFEIYKGTQQQLLTSDHVFIAALRKPETANLPVIQKEDDPVRWLSKNLRVDFPGNAEIMRVSLTGTRADEVAVLVGAVVSAYMNEAVEAERHRQNKRVEDLDRLYTEKESEMRSRRTELKQLAEQLGTGDTAALALKQQIALQQYSESRNEHSRLRTELQRAQEELQSKQKWLKAIDEGPQPAAEVETASVADSYLTKMMEQVEDIDNRLASIRERATETLQAKLSSELLQRKKNLEKAIADHRQELAANRQKTPRLNSEPLLAELKVRTDILAEQEKLAAKVADDDRQKAERFGNSSIDVEMMRNELQYLEKVLSNIADEREKFKVELRTTPRITVFQPAEQPTKPDSKSRAQNVAFAGIGFFLCGFFSVLWWDVSKQRINSLVDVSRGLGLTVVGTVPWMPPRTRRKIGPSKRERKWQASLDHAVDGIAARLFLRKEAGDVRVVLVSSATQGEGKSLLAANLAKRLARTGERTLLVDFDLRRPAIHRMFGISRGPGVSDCLAGGVDIGQVARPTQTENLYVVTSGEFLSESLGPLANGVTTSFFAKARAAFAFVIIDGSPILPVIDGLLASQHADTVILSVRRDTSEAPKVLRACEKLTAFGSRKYVVVLNGSQEEMYGSYHENVVETHLNAVNDAVTVPG